MNVRDDGEDTSTPVESMSYEQAKQELRLVVQRLEANTGPLEETLSLWERGQLLAARCKAILDAAAQQVESASASPAQGEQQPF